MAKETWKAGNMLYPLPAVMVSVSDGEGNDNIITVAWAGTVCTNPPMVSISVRPSRFSYDMIKKTGEFVINLTTEKPARSRRVKKEAAEEVPAEKPKRGRPRKVKEQEPEVTPKKEAAEVPAEKPKRGRPRKKPVEAAAPEK